MVETALGPVRDEETTRRAKGRAERDAAHLHPWAAGGVDDESQRVGGVEARPRGQAHSGRAGDNARGDSDDGGRGGGQAEPSHKGQRVGEGPAGGEGGHQGGHQRGVAHAARRHAHAHAHAVPQGFPV